MTDIPYSQELLRKSIHLSSLWIPAFIFIAPQKYIPATVFALLLSANVFIEYGYYKKWPIIVKTYGRLFSKMLREKETKCGFHFSGSPYVLAAALFSCLLFPALNAAVALSVMLISDTAAALIGRICGKHKMNNGTKSIEGSCAFLLFGFLILYFVDLFLHPAPLFLLKGGIGVFLAMFAEIYENKIKIDDNLSIPLIIGTCLSL